MPLQRLKSGQAAILCRKRHLALRLDGHHRPTNFAMESKLTSFVAWRSDSVSQAFPAHPVGLRCR